MICERCFSGDAQDCIQGHVVCRKCQHLAANPPHLIDRFQKESEDTNATFMLRISKNDYGFKPPTPTERVRRAYSKFVQTMLKRG